MPSPKKAQIDGSDIFITLGAICTMLLWLVVWQPKVGVWIAEAGEAESAITMGATASIAPAAEPMRRPIQPTAWVQVIDSGKRN